MQASHFKSLTLLRIHSVPHPPSNLLIAHKRKSQRSRQFNIQRSNHPVCHEGGGETATFVNQGVFGMGVGRHSDGTFDRVWFKEPLSAEEVAFDSHTFLILRDKAQAMASPPPTEEVKKEPQEEPITVIEESGRHSDGGPVILRFTGTVPPEPWNKLGTRLIPKLRSGKRVELVIAASVEVQSASQKNLVDEIKQILSELGLNWTVGEEE